MENTISQRIKAFANYKRISIAEFEKRANLSNGYANNVSKGIGSEKLKGILEAFSELNREWLLYGEGSMIRTDTPTISVIGNNNVSGVNNRVEKAENAALLDELAAQRLLTEKAVNQLAETQRQMASLLSILEKVTTSDK